MMQQELCKDFLRVLLGYLSLKLPYSIAPTYHFLAHNHQFFEAKMPSFVA